MSHKSRVFIPQEPTRVKKEKCGVTGEMIPVRDDSGKIIIESLMDFSKAGEYGETVVCLPPGRVALNPQPTLHRLRECMSGFNDNDYLIAVGDPSVIAMAAAIAAEANRGKFKLLKYDQQSRSYVRVAVDLHFKPGGL